MTARPDVLVVGAGPTGLTLALQAHGHGATVRVVERRTDIFRPSRALIVHPRTLEVLRPLGVVDELLARADISPRACLHLGSRTVPVHLAELDLPDTAFPHLSLLRQADVEAVLSRALADRGVAVERGTELVGISNGEDPTEEPRLALRSPAGIENAVAGSVVGCDGTASTVRAGCGIGWRGGPYRHEIVLADLELDGDLEPGVAHVVAGRRGLVFVFALGERATWRLLATQPAGRAAPRSGPPSRAVAGEELQRLLTEAGLPARITEVGWSSLVRVQHRLATAYRRNRLFLAGDAAHASSPAAAQGMNTGIQDAANLGWKLAFASNSTDAQVLLDSYELERRAVARQVVALTHLVFWAEAGTDPLASFVRGMLAPLAAPAIPAILDRRRLVAEAVRVLSQLRVGYRGSPLSVEGRAQPRRGLRAGDRLPDATVTTCGERVRLHALLARPGLHVLLRRDARAPGPEIRSRWVHLHRLSSAPGTGLLAVRPDGYVGFRGGTADDGQLRDWLAMIGVADGSGA